MRCPACGSEMAYSVLGHGFICIERECGMELEMDEEDAELILQPADELVFA
jgi:hypothetical protein